MAIGGYTSNNTMLTYETFRPKQRLSEWAAAKDQEMRYLALQGQMAEQDYAEAQQRVSQQQQAMAALRNMEVEDPDKKRINAWFDENDKLIADRVFNQYGGDGEAYFAAEGTQALQQIMTRLQSSPIYKNALMNKDQVARAKDAMSKGQVVIGKLDPTTGIYASAEEELSRFLNGQTETYTFRGSYDPTKADVVKYFGGIANPNGYFDTANNSVPEDQVLSKLMDDLGAEAGRDAYLRSYIGRKVKYKTGTDVELQKHLNAISQGQISLNKEARDAAMFPLEQAAKRASIASSQSTVSLNRAKQQALANASSPVSIQNNQVGGDRSFLSTTLMNPLGATNIPVTGVKEADRNTGFVSLPGATFGDLISQDRSGSENITLYRYGMGPASSAFKAAAGIPKNGDVASFSEIVLPGQHGKVVDITQFPGIKVLSSGNELLIDGKAQQSMIDTGGRYPNRGFIEATVEVPGEYSNMMGLERSFIFDWGLDTKMGSSKFAKERADDKWVLKVLVPVVEPGNFITNKAATDELWGTSQSNKTMLGGLLFSDTN